MTTTDKDVNNIIAQLNTVKKDDKKTLTNTSITPDNFDESKLKFEISKTYKDNYKNKRIEVFYDGVIKPTIFLGKNYKPKTYGVRDVVDMNTQKPTGKHSMSFKVFKDPRNPTDEEKKTEQLYSRIHACLVKFILSVRNDLDISPELEDVVVKSQVKKICNPKKEDLKKQVVSPQKYFSAKVSEYPEKKELAKELNKQTGKEETVEKIIYPAKVRTDFYNKSTKCSRDDLSGKVGEARCVYTLDSVFVKASGGISTQLSLKSVSFEESNEQEMESEFADVLDDFAMDAIGQ